MCAKVQSPEYSFRGVSGPGFTLAQTWAPQEQKPVQNETIYICLEGPHGIPHHPSHFTTDKQGARRILHDQTTAPHACLSLLPTMTRHVYSTLDFFSKGGSTGSTTRAMCNQKSILTLAPMTGTTSDLTAVTIIGQVLDVLHVIVLAATDMWAQSMDTGQGCDAPELLCPWGCMETVAQAGATSIHTLRHPFGGIRQWAVGSGQQVPGP